jgi:hypothetical protein
MSTLKITAKGQIIFAFSQDALKHLGVQPGDKVSVQKLLDGRIELRPLAPRGRFPMPSISSRGRTARPSLSKKSTSRRLTVGPANGEDQAVESPPQDADLLNREPV